MAGRGLTLRAAVAVSAVAIALAAVPAVASEVTRDSYREAVEPICKVNTEANERILRGVRAKVRQGKLKPVAAQFSKAAAALKGTLAQLRAVPRPSADRARLAKWLSEIQTEVGYFEKIAAKLRAGNKIAAEGMVVRLTHYANVANNLVIGFEFEYCRFEPSRFT